MKIFKRNRNVYYIVRFFSNLAFTMPIWVAFYSKTMMPGQISILVAIQYSVQMIVEIPSGAIADMLGRKNTVSVGLLFGLFSTIIIIFASSFLHFTIAMVFMGVMDSLISGADEALQYDSLKQDGVHKSFKKVYSRAYILLQSGLAIGALLGGFLYNINNYLPYILCTTALIVSLIASRYYIEPRVDSEIFKWKNYKIQLAEGIKESFKTPALKLISVYFIVVGGITWASQSYFNTSFMTQLITNDSIRGVIQATIRIINILLIQIVFSKNFLKTTTQKFICFIVLMCFAYIPGFAVQESWGVLFIYFATLASTIRWIYMAEVMNPLLDSKHRATALSTISMAVSIVNIILYAISAYVIPQYGIGAMYTILGAVTILILVPIVVIWITKNPGNSLHRFKV